MRGRQIRGWDVGVVGNNMAALRLRDPRQTQAHLTQCTYYPIVDRYQSDPQPFSSHRLASDVSVRLMRIPSLKRNGNQLVHVRGTCACGCSHTHLRMN